MRVNRDMLEWWQIAATASPNPKETGRSYYRKARLRGYRIEQERERLISPWEDFRDITPNKPAYDESYIERINGTCDPTDTANDIERDFKQEYGRHVSVPWDCSGQWFTARVKAVKMTDTTFTLIHRMELDI